MTKQEKADYDRAYRKKNRVVLNEKAAAYRKLHLEDLREKERKRFAKRSINSMALRILWNIGNAERLKAYNAARNKEPVRVAMIKKASKAWKDAHKEERRNHVRNRRAKLRNGGVLSKNIEQKLMKLQKGLCPVCKTSLAGAFHLDHIIAVANRGRNEDYNVQLLCPPCNQSKSDRHPVDFMQSRGFLL